MLLSDPPCPVELGLDSTAQPGSPVRERALSGMTRPTARFRRCVKVPTQGWCIHAQILVRERPLCGVLELLRASRPSPSGRRPTNCGLQLTSALTAPPLEKIEERW